METLANIESFVQTARKGSFSAAARELGLTPAAISRNVAMLEKNIGVRLFQRSTRFLTLTEGGERLLSSIGDSLAQLQDALAGVSSLQDEPTGTLRISVSPVFGMRHILPLLPQFLKSYPRVQPDLNFDNRPAELIAGGYDIAIGGTYDLPEGVISRTLAPAHIIVVASPSYMQNAESPLSPRDLIRFDGVGLRSAKTGSIRQWTLMNETAEEVPALFRQAVVVDDPNALREAARQGIGVVLTAIPDVADLLETGELVRLLPDWYADAGNISCYFPSRRQLPPKTRVFIDFLVEAAKRSGFAENFSARRIR
ncbi:LysR family transcriptional regulator [Ensifer adhaerens]|uniref:LysR family transcriptional regulator n=1 Tax=Ensifer adhaerens TaxID=106592 RepID=A0A9Q8YJE5_ENSAD|nr:LysR family transcriptional regulator [Ensifer adhaerens]USJ28504.1 LysR family transcriptional regulator [Ensifer adhaerens]